MDIDLTFFKNWFGSKEEEEEKKEKKVKESNNKNNKKEDKKKDVNKNKNDKMNSNVISKEESKKEIKEINNENKINVNTKEDENDNNIVLSKSKKTKTKADHKNPKENEKREGLKKKEELTIYLLKYIKYVFLFKRRIKKLIQRQKENYAIISSINSKDLNMEIYLSEDKTQKVKYTYEPILQQNIFYIPKKILKKKNLLKFSFINKKKESIIDPKFNTEYDCGEFINVINLKKIKDKEEEKEEDFQTFLESYYTLRQSMSKAKVDINKLKLEKVRVKKKHKTVDNKKGLLFGVNKIGSNSILRQRGEHRRVTSNKRISFSDKNETISYKKDD